MKHHYIAIEGPIGAGKTTLARMLASELDARLMLERVEDNPFLARFYESRKEWAFQTQVFFLLSRFRSQSDLAAQDLFNQFTVSDHIFDKDRIFASVNLTDDEFALYEQIYSLLDRRLPRPDLVILLQASTRVLLERVRKRAKDYEKGVDAKYLETLAAAYTDYFFNYTDTPLLVVNTDNIDFVANQEDFDGLLREIKSFKRGVKYFSPLGSV